MGMAQWRESWKYSSKEVSVAWKGMKLKWKYMDPPYSISVIVYDKKLYLLAYLWQWTKLCHTLKYVV